MRRLASCMALVISQFVTACQRDDFGCELLCQSDKALSSRLTHSRLRLYFVMAPVPPMIFNAKPALLPLSSIFAERDAIRKMAARSQMGSIILRAPGHIASNIRNLIRVRQRYAVVAA